MVAGLNIKPAYLIAAGAIVAAVVYVSAKGARNVATGVGVAVGEGAVDLVNGVMTGGTYAIADGIGVPRTDQTECERAIAEGRTWDASFACPAGTFLKSLFN